MVCVCVFRLRSMLHLSVRSYERVLQWPYHELFRDPNSALYPRILFPSLSLTPTFDLPHSFSPPFSLSLLLSIISGGLTVNSELYVYTFTYTRTYARVTKQYTQSKSFRAWPQTKTRGACCTPCVCGRHQDRRYHRPTIDDRISLTPPCPPPLRLFAHRPTENVYVQSLQSLRH